MNGRSPTAASTLDPTKWAWYREFGGLPSMPLNTRRRNGRIARKAWFRGGAVLALAGAAVVVSVLLTVLGFIEPLVELAFGWLVLAVLPACLACLGVTAVRARRRNMAAASRCARAERILGDATPETAGMARLLESLLSIPGTEIFHSLRLSGATPASADHAVVRGNTVFLLEAQRRPGRPGSLHSTAEEFRALLGPDVEVIPLMLVHPRSALPTAAITADGVHVASVGQSLERIGDTFAYSFGDWRTRPDVRASLVATLA
jgi:hypothetical protein